MHPMFYLSQDSFSLCRDPLVQETLRIQSNTGTLIERKVLREVTIIDGYQLPGGTTVGIILWVLNRNRRDLRLGCRSFPA